MCILPPARPPDSAFLLDLEKQAAPLDPLANLLFFICIIHGVEWRALRSKKATSLIWRLPFR